MCFSTFTQIGAVIKTGQTYRDLIWALRLPNSIGLFATFVVVSCLSQILPTPTAPQDAIFPVSTDAGRVGNARAAKVETVTLGCRLNLYESEAMRVLAEAAGHEDIIVINTCAVTAEAVRQARQTIRRKKRENPNARLIVTGCAAQIEPETFAQMGEVDLILGNGEKTDAKVWQSLPALKADNGPATILVNDAQSITETASHLIDGVEERARAYVQVQNGCDHRCTFCIIPYGRGPSRSVPAGEVVAMVTRLVNAGIGEVVLSGVDMTSWGTDLPGRPQLGDLVRRILTLVPTLQRLRLSSIDAIELDPVLLRLLGDEPRLMPHVHLSLQHGDDLILKRMKRRHSRAQALDLVGALYEARPDLLIGADLIAGFPTETDDHHQANLSLIEEAKLAFCHIFPFSPRTGTPAAKMPQLDRSLIKARAEALRLKAAEISAQQIAPFIGRTMDVFIEQVKDKGEIIGKGRLNNFAEVSVSGLSLASNIGPGSTISAKITGLAPDHASNGAARLLAQWV